MDIEDILMCTEKMADDDEVSDFPTGQFHEKYPDVRTIIDGIANILEDICFKNQNLVDALLEVPECHFITESLPVITVKKFLQRCYRYAYTDISSYICALVYIYQIDRHCDKSKLAITYLNIVKVFNVALLVAAKYLDDGAGCNKRHAEIVGVKLGELNRMECCFLEIFNFDVATAPIDFENAAKSALQHAYL